MINRVNDSSLSVNKGYFKGSTRREAVIFCPGCLSGLISFCMPNVTSLPLLYFNENYLSLSLCNLD